MKILPSCCKALCMHSLYNVAVGNKKHASKRHLVIFLIWLRTIKSLEGTENRNREGSVSPVSSNLRTRRHQMKLGKARFKTKKGSVPSWHMALDCGNHATKWCSCSQLMCLWKSDREHSKKRNALSVIKCQVTHPRSSNTPCSICESTLGKHHIALALHIFHWGGYWRDGQIC